MSPTDKKAAEVYRMARIWGLVSFIPVVMAAGPIAGYFLGEYLERKFGFAPYLSISLVALGFIAAAREVVRILRLINKSDRKS
jgi:F0F1-type ATP synthase assembly protein I